MNSEKILQDQFEFLVERIKVMEVHMGILQTQLQYLVDKSKYKIDSRTEADQVNGTLIRCKACLNEQVVFHFQRQTEFCKGCGIHREMFEEWELV
jgi:ribosomal protein S27E|tara:strand:+ start:224 stop:508 length:285 start_codon:yes stop_codon:yes gene_type:complete